ncbi:hypothetical protein BC941DRAFT_87379 [Chlamydoabsidia padenii]|nr:hypothetical protein BC941DRAFT_87379 [Chlamydoabsidia padenii]
MFFMLGIPLDFFLSTTTNSASCVEEALTPRVFFGWRHILLQYLLGKITFPSIDLPVAATSTPRRYRLWGMTLAMTRDLIQLTGVDDIPFLALVATLPQYSRKDIGWWIQIITRITCFWRRKSSTLSSRQQRTEWSKTYYGSMRAGVVMAMVTRIIVAVMGASWLLKRCYRQFRIDK